MEHFFFQMQSLPLVLLFCGSAEDLKLRDLNGNEDEQEEGIGVGRERRTSVATDKEIRALDDPLSSQARTSDPRMARCCATDQDFLCSIISLSLF